jgi:hypothetical protein
LTTSATSYWLNGGASWGLSPNTLDGSTGTERWQIGQSVSGTVSASQTITFTYYNQYSITPYYTTSDSSSPVVTNAVGYTQFGSVATDTPTKGSSGGNPVWVDASSSVSYLSPLSGVTGERWQVTAADTKNYTVISSVSSSITTTVQYYHQFSDIISYSISGGGSPTVPTLSANKFGSSVPQTLTNTATNYWYDAGTSWSVTPNPLTGSGSYERWETSQSTSGTFSSSATTTITLTFYHQFTVTPYYTISDSSNPAVTNIVSYTQFGNAAASTPTKGTSGGTPIWMDANTAVKYTSPITSSGERWQVASGDTANHVAITSVSSSGVASINYYHQYQVPAKYSTSDSSTPSAAVVLSGTQFGSPLPTTNLGTSSSNLWLDAATSWSVNIQIPASPTTEQWIASAGTSGTVSSTTNVQPTYSHQYKLSFSLGAGGASMSPSGNNIWTQAGSLTIQATPSAGFSFSTWSFSGTGTLTFGNSHSASTSATVSGSGTITATFGINTFTITPSASSGGSITPNSPQVVNYGQNSPTFAFTPNTGYHIADVKVGSVDLGVVTSYQYTNVQADSTLSVTFAINTYTITVSAGGNGTITPGSGSVNYGGNATYAITPNIGYYITSITVDSSPILVTNNTGQNVTFTNVTNNHSISATFGKIA